MLTKKQIKIINVVNAVIRFFPNRENSIERKRGIKMEDNIELVIKLPKGIYVASPMLNVKPDDVVQIPLEVIANGTPLPKGHGKIIDESQITEVYIRATEKRIYQRDTYTTKKQKIIDTNAPTIIQSDKTESEG